MSSRQSTAKAGPPGGKPKVRVAEATPNSGVTAAAVSTIIDRRIRDLAGWRSTPLARMRALILEADPDATEEVKRLFNSSLDGNARRSIDTHEGETVDAVAFKKLVKAGVAWNAATARRRSRGRRNS